MGGGAVRHNFERDTPRDHLRQAWTLHRCLLPSLAPFGQAVSEQKIVLTLANQKQALPLAAIFVGRMGRNEDTLQRTLYRCFLPSLVPFGQQTWPPRLIIFSDWLMFKKSSPLKQLGQMEPNLAGSIYVRSKPGIDGPWVCPFQNCVRQPHPPFKMAAVF